MARSASFAKYYQRVFLLILFFAAAGASFNGFYAKWHFREAGTTQYIQRMSFESMVDGTADRPFVYRQLLPMAVNWIDARISDHDKDAIYGAKSDKGIPVLNFVFDSPITKDREHLFRYTILYVAVAIFVWMAVWAMYFAATAAGQPKVSAALASVTMILLMPYFLSVGGYFYDYPELAFFALAVYIAIRFDWWWTIPIAILGTWNKESFLFFIPSLYPLLRQKSSRRTAWLATAILTLTSGVVYQSVRLRFQQNPGSTVEVHFWPQIKSIFIPTNWFLMDVTYGELVFRGINPFSILLVVGAFICGFRQLPEAIRRHVQIVALINGALFICFGFPGEIRGLSMLYVSLLLVLAANVTSWLPHPPMQTTEHVK